MNPLWWALVIPAIVLAGIVITGIIESRQPSVRDENRRRFKEMRE